MSEAITPWVGAAASLSEVLDDALIQHKREVALIEADRKRERSRWTFADVQATVRRVAYRLVRAGVGPDDRVAILMANQPSWLITAIAALRRGAVLVPLDARLQPEEQRDLIAHCRPAVLVVDDPAGGAWRCRGATAPRGCGSSRPHRARISAPRSATRRSPRPPRPSRPRSAGRGTIWRPSCTARGPAGGRRAAC